MSQEISQVQANAQGFQVMAIVPAAQLEQLSKSVALLLEKIDLLQKRQENWEKPLKSKKEVMEYFDISEGTYYNWLNDKRNPMPYSSRGGKKFFFKSKINEWFQQRGVKS